MRKTVGIKRPIAVLILASLLVGMATFLAHENRAFGQERRTLWWGRSGSDVRLVQSTLSNWGYYKGKIDGYYAYSTVAAVRRFQRDAGLFPDGVVGRKTWEALGFPVIARAQTAFRPVTRNDELSLLARVITGEAQGEPYEGQVAVGAVILNRVRHPSFPKTLAGVIYEPWAFESVANGLIWTRPISPTAWRAAQDALNGWDPTFGSVFFWNPSKPVSGWIWTRKIITRLGNHVFAR